MREASCRGLEVVERAAAENGIRYDELVRDLPVSLERLHDRGERIDWEVFATICERFESATSPEASVQAGRAVVKLELSKPIAAVASLALDARYLYRFGQQWLLPVIIRVLRVHIDEVAPRKLRIEITIPEDLAGCASLLRMFHGTFEASPTALRLPPSRVESEITPHRGIYYVTLPEQRRSPLAILRALLSGRALAQLEGQVEALRALEREHVKVDEALRERERTLSNLIANLSGIVYRCHVDDFRFEFAGGRCLELTGYSQSELVAQRLSLLALAHPEDAESLRESLRTNLATQQPSSNEYRMKTRSGELRWVLDVARGVYDAQGRNVGIEGFMTDVTGKKQLEQELNHALRVESIGRLAGGIAHDFNNLLTVMLGSIELADDLLPQDSPARELTDQVRTAAERAAALTGQLLTFARKHAIEPRIVDLNALVLGVDTLLRRALGEDVEIASVLEPELWRVEVDPGQFEQVLLNLAVNARDAMPHGGTLSLETANIVLEEHANALPSVEPGLYVMLSVRDNGVGMTDEVRKRAFEPFFTTKALGQGTGLGLASCHGIVSQAHGHIFLSSALEHGTEFRIYLPRAAGVSEQGAKSEPLEAPPPGRETVLVVEDNDLVRGMVVRSLAAQGYLVLAAASGVEALELAAQTVRAIDLLVTDVVMPQMSGLALAAKLLESRPSLPVLFVSGYSEQNVMHEHRASSTAAFLAKPFTPRALACKVRDVLDSAALNAQVSPEPRLRVVC